MTRSQRRYLVPTLVLLPLALACTGPGQSNEVEERPPPGDSEVLLSNEESGWRAEIVDVTDANFSAEVLSASMPVLVYYTAQWAGPPRMLAPVVHQIADEYSGRLKVVRLDVDPNPTTPAQYGVSHLPTLMLFVEGAIAGRQVGVLPREQLGAWLETHLRR
jgi:thioredoxin 1